MSTLPTRYVAGFCFNEAMTHVVLIEKLKPEWMKGKINGVGGKIEGFESPEQAMSREFAEEAGLLIPERDWHRFAVLHTTTESHVHFFYSVLAGHRISEASTKTSERVFVQSVTGERHKWMPNLPWLVEMARSMAVGADRAAWFHVHEVPKV